MIELHIELVVDDEIIPIDIIEVKEEWSVIYFWNYWKENMYLI